MTANKPDATTLNPLTDLVYVEIKKKTKDALLRLIEREREGELVDRALIKNILGIFIEVGMGCKWCLGCKWVLGLDSGRLEHVNLLR